MFIDATELPSGEVMDAEICIIGGGPAGLSLAVALTRMGRDVLLLEAGGLQSAPARAEFAPIASGPCFDSAGMPVLTRQWGGNANEWQIQTRLGWRGVRLVPFQPMDFMPRHETGRPGWPISFDSLVPHYAQAAALLDMGAAEPWTAQGWPLDGTALETALYRFADARVFLDRHRHALSKSETTRVLLNTQALELVSTDDGGRVRHVRAAAAPGHEFHVQAGVVVVACGGLGATRLLLCSDGRHAGGLGNAHGHLGRYLMDHPLVDAGDLTPATPALFAHSDVYDLRWMDESAAMGHLRLRDEQAGDGAALGTIVFPRETGAREKRLEGRQAAAFWAAVRVRHHLRRGAWPGFADVGRAALGIDGIARHLWRTWRHPTANLARGGWSEATARRYATFEVLQQVEQFPHPDNGVRLSRETDAYGMRRIEISWQWHRSDREAAAASQRLVARELERAGIGTLRRHADADGLPVLIAASTGHHMGTTRMSARAADGVVDETCRVHGVSNLYVCSSSVFPTGGYANPTFTIVALAARLAEHLGPRPSGAVLRPQATASEAPPDCLRTSTGAPSNTGSAAR